MRYSKYGGRGKFFSLPHEGVFPGVRAGGVSVYRFLERCGNRQTHGWWASVTNI